MFELEQQIKTWRVELERKRVGGPDILDELESHLREQFARLHGRGMSDAESFRIAVNKLGPADHIKHEFLKLRNERGTAFILGIFAVWYVLMGLSTLSSMPIFGIDGFSQNAGRSAVCAVLFGLQMLVGIGLMLRKSFWRWCALGWAALFLSICVITLHPLQGSVGHLASWGFQPAGDFTSRLSLLSHWQITLFGTRLADFRHVIDFLSPGVLLWALYFLSRPKVKTLFQKVNAS